MVTKEAIDISKEEIRLEWYISEKAFRAPWLASSEVNGKYYSPLSKRRKQNGFRFRFRYRGANFILYLFLLFNLFGIY